MTDSKLSLKHFISREFFKAALLPLLFIELALVLLYFRINAYNQDKSIATLRQQSVSHLEEIAGDQARLISEQLSAVTALGHILQAETEQFFDHPDLLPLASQEPATFEFASNGIYYKTNNNGGCSLYYSTLTPIGAPERRKAARSEALDPIYKHLFQANPNIVALERTAKRIGYAAVGGMIAFYLIFFVYLIYNAGCISKRIATPVADISAASSHIAAGEYDLQLDTCQIRELDDLSDNYTRMARDMKHMHEKLKNEVQRANREIDERRHAQKALWKSEQKLQAIYNHTFQFIGLLNPDGTVLGINKTALDFAGIDESDVIGKPFWETPWWTHSQKSQNRLRSAIGKAADGQLVRFETTHQCHDGKFESIDFSLNPVTDEKGETTFLIPEGRKITELKRVEQELRAARDKADTANRTKSEFLANMSHELRTPLNHIIGFTELVLDKNFGDLNEVQEEYLNDALSSSRHLLSLINDILDLSKVEAGKMELEPAELNLKVLLENSLSLIREKAIKHGIRLSTDIDGIPATITADERKLKQIIYNLLSNAVKFTPNNGRISLEAKLIQEVINFSIPQLPNSFIQISVADTGIGIKPQDQERIFSPFHQVENSIGRRYPGTGLGLSLTKSLVELHGGRIWVQSDGERQGCTFCFILPT